MIGSKTRRRGLRDLNELLAGLSDPVPSAWSLPPGAIDERGAMGGSNDLRINEMEGVRDALANNALRPAPEYAGPAGGPAAPMHQDAHSGSHAADYEGHYRMHGRDASGLLAGGKKKRSLGQKILKGLGDFAINYSASQGDPGAILALRERAVTRLNKKKTEAEFAEHNRLVGVLMRQGMSADQAELAALNKDKLGEEYATRFRTRGVSKGGSVRTPNFDGSDQVFTAPETFQNGADVLRIDPRSPEVSRMGTGSLSMRTEAQQYADTVAQRGSPEWLQAAQDYVLKGEGPTAYGFKDSLQDQRIASQNRNTDLRVGVSERNSIRSANTQRYGRDNTPAATVINERGEPVVVYPNNRVTTLRGAQPMPTSRGGRGAGRSGGRGVAEGTVIQNPQTGEKMIRRNGQWVAHR